MYDQVYSISSAMQPTYGVTLVEGIENGAEGTRKLTGRPFREDPQYAGKKTRRELEREGGLHLSMNADSIGDPLLPFDTFDQSGIKHMDTEILGGSREVDDLLGGRLRNELFGRHKTQLISLGNIANEGVCKLLPLKS